MDKITVKIKGGSRTFDFAMGKLVCVPYPKHQEVDLCLQDGMNVPFGGIKLYDSDLLADAKATYPDARKLGEEISRRWNDYREITALKAELQKAINERNEAWFQLEEAGIEIKSITENG